MDDIFVYFQHMPPGVNEAVLPCNDGYTVYINDSLDHAHAIRAYKHAVTHILRNDCIIDGDIQSIESEVHTLLKDDNNERENIPACRTSGNS